MVSIMRKIEIQRANFKAAKAAGTLTDPTMTFKAYQVEQALIEEFKNLPVVTPEPSILEEAHQLLELIDDTLTTIDSAVVQLQDEVRTHIPDVSTTPLKKMGMARQIFNREMDNAVDEERPMNRKTVIQQFLSIAGLSKNGAATYYQNIKREKGMIGS
jgi:paraquat-inducible protein B